MHRSKRKRMCWPSFFQTMSSSNANLNSPSKSPETTAQSQATALASESDKTCVVCFKIVDIFSIGECDHPVCYECSTSMNFAILNLIDAISIKKKPPNFT